MGRALQLGDTQVDETKLADLCGQYRVRELSLFGPRLRLPLAMSRHASPAPPPFISAALSSCSSSP
jgi:hypothetical protein